VFATAWQIDEIKSVILKAVYVVIGGISVVLWPAGWI
jgi:hypothetical protein